jgi:hypothetical protein
MTDTDQTTYADEHDTGGAHRDSATDTEDSSAGQSQSQAGAGSTAAERLGGPSESEAAAERGDAGDNRSTGSTGSSGTSQATLIPADRAESFRGRWNELKGEFVDEPRTAVRGANELVGEVLDELEQLFRRQRDELESGLEADDTTTEDLRQALGNYRSFFDRLLSF